MKHKEMPLDDVWAAARFIWENTPKITDRDLVAQLQELFENDAPKSIGSISKRRKKEAWNKKNLIVLAQDTKKKEAEQEASAKNRKQNTMPDVFVSQKTNNVQTREAKAKLEAKNAKIEELTQGLVVNKEAKAALILKHRKRLANMGGVTDSILDIMTGLLSKAFDMGVDPEEIQKALVLSDSLSKSVELLSRAVKMLAETELPLSGITPDDLQESEQDRRLGALDKLKGIHEAENQARAAKLPELQERLRRMEVMNYEMDGGFADEALGDDGDIEEVDFTAVDGLDD